MRLYEDPDQFLNPTYLLSFGASPNSCGKIGQYLFALNERGIADQFVSGSDFSLETDTIDSHDTYASSPSDGNTARDGKYGSAGEARKFDQPVPRHDGSSGEMAVKDMHRESGGEKPIPSVLLRVDQCLIDQ